MVCLARLGGWIGRGCGKFLLGGIGLAGSEDEERRPEKTSVLHRHRLSCGRPRLRELLLFCMQHHWRCRGLSLISLRLSKSHGGARLCFKEERTRDWVRASHLLPLLAKPLLPPPSLATTSTPTAIGAPARVALSEDVAERERR